MDDATSSSKERLGSFVNEGADISVSRFLGRNFAEVVSARLTRRRALLGLSGVALGGALNAATSRLAWANGSPSTLKFDEVKRGYDATHHVAAGYDADVLIRWGDPVAADAPPFDPHRQMADAQEKQFGYNNDYVAFLPLPLGSNNAERGLLCVNHEFTNAELMFPGIAKRQRLEQLTHDEAEIELAAHGHSVLEIRRENGRWQVVRPSRYNRRITMRSTEMIVSGPAAGHDRLKTSADPTGTRVVGTLNNCAGGMTPWGTVMIAEENFHAYFGGKLSDAGETRNHKRYGVGDYVWFGWYHHLDRFDLGKEPNEPNRFGWMVEYDPYDPTSVPVKRTALGRFKHEGANSVVNKDGRVVFYSGDDETFEYVYRFVTAGKYDPADRNANRDLLDDGELSVARFDPDGTMTWLPLVHGQGPLTAANGFASRADLLIETRRAADLVGATPMDRPEDIETNPVTGRVYVSLTSNPQRTAAQAVGPNARAKNRYGQVLEMIPPGGRGRDADHAAATFRWEVPILAGDPANAASGAHYHPDTGREGWFVNPDNVAFDSAGRLWIATDGGPYHGFADGLWATDTEGPGRMLPRHFFSTPRGAEMCGPCFTPDDRTLFVAVQHPGDESGSSFAAPTTRWPDFDPNMPPRPSVVVITKRDGGAVGG